MTKTTLQSGEYLWDDASMSRMGRYLTSRALGFINRSLPAHLKGSLLDLGCGTGKLSRPMASRGFDVISLEYDHVPLALFRQRDPQAQLVQADAQYLPFKDESFDVILAVEMLDYLPDRPRFYTEAWRTLKPGGLMLATLTNRRSIKGALYEAYLRKQRRERIRRYYEMNLEQGLTEIRKAGFEIGPAWGYNWNILPRNTNSRLVELCSSVERLFKLENIPSLSPLVFVVVRKP